MTRIAQGLVPTTYASFGLIAALLTLPAQSLIAEEAAEDEDAPLAVISIPTPREVSLLKLNDVDGKDTVLINLDGDCYRLPVRVVADDFDGKHISIKQSGPIEVHITDSKTVRGLHEGDDMPSNGDDPAGHDAEAGIHIEVDPSLGAGFAISPGLSVLADIFGSRSRQIACAEEMEEASDRQ
ncbi:hypothetical protein [Celeribacter sp.]|uniref:hypothetical protein n=1 Tax=Celeribacter sp. TaxID=1890673 RepID=UPI003A91718B